MMNSQPYRQASSTHRPAAQAAGSVPRASSSGSGRRVPGFTLTELMVAIGIIAIILAIVLPSLKGLFTTGADIQARGVMSSMLGAARGLAIENQSHAAVHIQMGADEKCWAAIMIAQTDPSGQRVLRPAPGYVPQKMPGNIAFGEVSAQWVEDVWEPPTPPQVLVSHYRPILDQALPGAYVPSTTYFAGDMVTSGVTIYISQRAGNVGHALTDATWWKVVAVAPAGIPDLHFTTINVIFAPDGSYTDRISPRGNRMDLSAPIFSGTTGQAIWSGSDTPSNRALLEKAGVRSMTMFDYVELRHAGTGTSSTPLSRANLLENKGAFLCVSPITGQLLLGK